jgi:hypothetical protein
MVRSERHDHCEARAHSQWAPHGHSPPAMTTARSLIAEARARASRFSLAPPSSGGHIYTSATSKTLSLSTQPLNHSSSDWPTRPPIVAASLHQVSILHPTLSEQLTATSISGVTTSLSRCCPGDTTRIKSFVGAIVAQKTFFSSILFL